MFANFFTTVIVQPLFNLLTLIYALLPGHNFGLAIIIFTIVVRLLMWPLVKKQLHHAKAMRALQPELKRIKKEAGKDKRKEQMMVMELYKERQINPFAPIGMMLVQLPILLGLYSGLRKIVNDPHQLVEFSYPFIRDLSWMKQLGSDITKFDHSLFGLVDLSRAAVSKGQYYIPALIIVVGSGVAQFFQSRQLLPSSKDARKLRHILRDASSGQSADQSEVNAAVGRSTQYLVPVMIVLFTINLASALSLYWLTGGIVAILQQAKILKKDEVELEAIADAETGKARVVPNEATTKTTSNSKNTKSTARVVVEGEVVKTKKSPAKKAKKRRR